MQWKVELHSAFLEEFQQFDEQVQDSILAKSLVLEEFGPQLGRPHVDTLNGSNYANMKEIRLNVNEGAWRVAFAFDPQRKAVLLVAADKAGKNQKQFYKELIAKADQRFNQHLQALEKEGK